MTLPAGQSDSDAETGLPPLDEPEPELTLLVTTFVVTEGVARLPTSPDAVAVRYLSVRGLAAGPDGEAEWNQAHIAFPAAVLARLAARLTEPLDA